MPFHRAFRDALYLIVRSHDEDTLLNWFRGLVYIGVVHIGERRSIKSEPSSKWASPCMSLVCVRVERAQVSCPDTPGATQKQNGSDEVEYLIRRIDIIVIALF